MGTMALIFAYNQLMSLWKIWLKCTRVYWLQVIAKIAKMIMTNLLGSIVRLKLFEKYNIYDCN